MRFEHWFYAVPLRLRSLFRRGRVEQELDEEFQYHLERQIQEQIAKGMTPDEARYAALRALGGLEQRKEECRDMRHVSLIENLLQDVRYGLRVLRRNPGFTTVAVLSLALGVGANTAVFSLINAVMLKSLPVESPEQLVRLAWGNPGYTALFPYPIFQQLRDHSPGFSDVLAWESTAFYIGRGENTDRIDGLSVSGNYYSALGVRPLLGRAISNQDDRPGSPPVAVLSHGLWQRMFAGDPAALGRNIVVEGVPCTIIGITSPQFFGTEPGKSPDVAVPLSLQDQIHPGLRRLESRDSIWLRIMARLRPDMSLDLAQSRLDALWPEMLKETVPTHHPIESQREFLSKKIVVSPGANGASELRQRFSAPLFVLMAIVGFVLLIACANVANMLLARALARRREISVRLAIGARRARLVRQLLTESLLLALLGGVAGAALAFAGSRLLVGLLSTRLVPVHLDLRPDLRVFVFAAMAALLTALFFGLAPALRASRYRATGILRESAFGAHGSTRRWGVGKMLVAFQMALSLLLLVGAGLFVRSLAKLASLDVGFRQEGLLLTVVDGSRTGHKGAGLADFYQQAVERVAGLPGVYSASLASRTPIGGDYWNSMISVEGSPPQAESMYVYFYRIGADFFRTFGTPLLSGRDFGPQDNESSRRVAIINESVAKSYFPSLNPLGRLISAPQDPERRDMEVIGIVKDAKYDNLRETRSHTIYLPYRQHMKRLRGMTISVRADPAVSEVTDLAKMIRREISSLQPEVAMTFRTMTEQVNQHLLEERLIAALSAFFGLLALLLAAVGLYGVMAYTVERRTWEVGIRMALGARRSDVVWLVFRETLALVALGASIGVLAAYGASRWIGSMLFGITPADPLAFAGATVLLLASALLGSYIPAMRAARVDPMVALRYE